MDWLTRAAGFVRPEPLVIGFCFLLPDLMDKPLWILGVVPDGRYIGHTLLILLLVTFAFAAVKWAYGLLAVCSWLPHLFFDTTASSYNPWYYPFRHYDFQPNDYHTIMTLHNLLITLLEMLAVFGVLILVWVMFRGAVLLSRAGPGPAGDQDQFDTIGDQRGVSHGALKDGRTPAHGRAPVRSSVPPRGSAAPHGSALCWTARASGTLMSLAAAVSLLQARATYDSAWPTIPAGLCLLALTVGPSVAGWWSHRTGGLFLIIVCVAYAEVAYGTAGDTGALRDAIPFLSVWTATGALHLAAWWKERRPLRGSLTIPPSRG